MSWHDSIISICSNYKSVDSCCCLLSLNQCYINFIFIQILLTPAQTDTDAVIYFLNFNTFLTRLYNLFFSICNLLCNLHLELYFILNINYVNVLFEFNRTFQFLFDWRSFFSDFLIWPTVSYMDLFSGHYSIYISCQVHNMLHIFMIDIKINVCSQLVRVQICYL